jgi:putative tryptophan/tyrosine transport system substrate-binding protein
MNKSWLCSLTCAALALLPVIGRAGNITVIKSQSSPPISQALEGFRSTCKQPIREIDLRGKADPKQVVDALRQTKSDILVAIGPQAAESARESVGDVPLLFIMVSNPAKRGLEGKNIAGISLNIPVLMQFTNYTNVVRNLKKLGVIYDEKKTGDMINEAKTEAGKVGIELVAISVTSQKAVADALKSLVAQKIDALWMVPDETVVTPASFQFLQKETSRNKLPLLAASEIFVEKGALASLSVDYKDMGRQAGEIANQIIQDRQQLARVKTVAPEKLNLAVNLGAARQLGALVNEQAIKLANKTYQ